MQSMVIRVPEITGYAGIRHVDVSLPYVAELVDGVKYRTPSDDMKPLEGTEAYRQRAPRVSLRRMVKWALACDADQQAKLRQHRYEREARLARQAAEQPAFDDALVHRLKPN